MFGYLVLFRVYYYKNKIIVDKIWRLIVQQYALSVYNDAVKLVHMVKDSKLSLIPVEAYCSGGMLC